MVSPNSITSHCEQAAVPLFYRFRKLVLPTHTSLSKGPFLSLFRDAPKLIFARKQARVAIRPAEILNLAAKQSSIPLFAVFFLAFQRQEGYNCMVSGGLR
jgi:hypothetical protein